MLNQSEAGKSDVDSIEFVVNQEIQNFIDENEMKTCTSSFSVSAVEQVSENKPSYSHIPKYETTQSKWYQNYTVPDGYYNWESVASIDSVAETEGDIRPKIFDGIDKTWTLIDGGSVVSCIPKKPGDVLDSSLRLRSVNGGIIPTFGSEEICVRLGRKEYKIQAIKADIPQRILGWDFLRKYRLSLDWNEFGDLFLIDKKAKIKQILQCEQADPKHSRISAVECYEEPEFSDMSPQSVFFQTECMKSVETTFAETTIPGHIDALQIDPDQSVQCVTIYH